MTTNRRAFASRSVCVQGRRVAHGRARAQPAAQPPDQSRRNAAPRLDGHRTAAHDGHELRDARDALQETVDLLTAADELDGVVALLVAQHARVELLQRGRELFRAAVHDLQLEQRELALDVIRARHIGDLYDVDELAELLADLVDHGIRTRS